MAEESVVAMTALERIEAYNRAISAFAAIVVDCRAEIDRIESDPDPARFMGLELFHKFYEEQARGEIARLTMESLLFTAEMLQTLSQDPS